MKDLWKCLVGVLWLAGTLVPHTTAASEPEVVKVGADHYRGTWLEIGRRPMWLMPSNGFEIESSSNSELTC